MDNKVRDILVWGTLAAIAYQLFKPVPLAQKCLDYMKRSGYKDSKIETIEHAINPESVPNLFDSDCVYDSCHMVTPRRTADDLARQILYFPRNDACHRDFLVKHKGLSPDETTIQFDPTIITASSDIPRADDGRPEWEKTWLPVQS